MRVLKIHNSLLVNPVIVLSRCTTAEFEEKSEKRLFFFHDKFDFHHIQPYIM